MAEDPAVVVIGSSAGGLPALKDLVDTLPRDFPGAVFIVRHFPPRAESRLPEVLAPVSKLRVDHAVHRARIEGNRIFVGPPGRHLILEPGRMELRYGPRINSVRPSIDTLFRSAARSYGAGTAGVVLSGTLDDGTAGLMAIQHSGGMTIVQEPEDAEFADMPLSVIKHLKADFVLPASRMVEPLTEFANRHSALRVPAVQTEPDDTVQMIDDDLAAQQRGERSGELTTFSCPECGGVLWQVRESEPPSFRCHVGHAYGAEHLLTQQSEVVEHSIWYTLRALKEVVLLSRQLANYARLENRNDAAQNFEQRSRQAERQLADLEGAICYTLPVQESETARAAGHVGRLSPAGPPEQ